MTYVAMRSQVPCPLDVYQEIQLACVEGRLVLTVPWVVEFLSMMDSLAPRLQYYSSVCKLLMQIHRCFAASFLERYSLNSFLTVVVLGWLFQLPQFPEELFFTDLDSLDCYNKDQNLVSTTGLTGANCFYSEREKRESERRKEESERGREGE
ncbi:codanin-1-like [Lingula anatina]|uniref:Codanin-1-like n=1 Tax=Lingula anatina TaxID=7574 RepID=A0A2R2ML72_LINAN|nr:codanin-1-like [Lingula anatina]|eukprot:XP_023930971.1 codanin-1-like [Lingula anatina]